jgi:hypothetical protein
MAKIEFMLVLDIQEYLTLQSTNGQQLEVRMTQLLRKVCKQSLSEKEITYKILVRNLPNFCKITLISKI